MSGSWLEHEGSSGELCSTALTWWRETTDVVILNSPFLKRSTGRALRCVWICFHFLRWLVLLLDDRHCSTLLLSSSRLFLEFLFVLCTFAYNVAVSLLTIREGFWTGLLFCASILLSFSCYDSVAHCTYPGEGGMTLDDFCYAMVTFSHCNVHPVALWPLLFFLSVSGELWHRADPQLLQGMCLHFLSSWLLILSAFSVDFSTRIKAVSSGVLHGETSSKEALDSPLAGRSGRTFCWLAALNSWLWLLMLASRLTFSDAKCSQVIAAAALLSILALLLLVPTKYHYALRADIALGLLCHGPPALLFFFKTAFTSGWSEDSEENLVVVMAMIFYSILAHLLALQTLIQAGCHPSVCACFALPIIFEGFLGAFQFDQVMEVTSWVTWVACPIVSFILITSHTIDFLARMKAIRAGLTSSEENARSAERFGRTLEPLGSRNEALLMPLRLREVAFSVTSRAETGSSLDAFRAPHVVPASPGTSWCS